MNRTKTSATTRPRILLVEDDDGVRRSLHLLLNGRGFDVRAFASGEDLLADPVSAEAACLIADYRMPDVDGLAVLNGLRARNWNHPAILVTAHRSKDLDERASAAGFARILDKPLRERELTDTVVRLLGEAAAPMSDDTV